VYLLEFIFFYNHISRGVGVLFVGVLHSVDSYPRLARVGKYKTLRNPVRDMCRSVQVLPSALKNFNTRTTSRNYYVHAIAGLTSAT
jgi:hypothetical protein